MLEAGRTSATVARRLSVLRGTYKELAAKGLVPWETAQDIAAVKGPGVQKNSTPSLTQWQQPDQDPGCESLAAYAGVRWAAGPPGHFSRHSFRVTTVTDLLDQNMPLEDVQYLAGHATRARPGSTTSGDKVTRNIVERISI